MAEYIVDITTQADRSGRAGQFADLYEASELKAENDRDLASASTQSGAVLERTQSVRGSPASSPDP